MAFTLSGSTITQTGTDTSLAGLSAIAGVITRVEGSGSFVKTRYYLPANTSLNYAILSFDPRYECLIFGTGACLLQASSTSSSLTIGVEITQFNGTYAHNSEAIVFTDNSGNGFIVTSGLRITQGTFNWLSGIIRGQTCMGIGASSYNNGGAVGTLLGRISKFATLEIMAPSSGQSSESCQIQYACAVNFLNEGLNVKGYGNAPSSALVSIASSTIYTNPPVFTLQGVAGITPQSNARTTNFANFYGFNATASPKGFNWFLGSLIRGINQSLGSSVILVEHNTVAAHSEGYAELRNEVDITLKGVNGNLIQGASIYCRDTNNGKRKIYNLNGQNINNTADKIYIGATDSNGNLKLTGVSGSVLIAAVSRTTQAYVGVDDFGLNEKDYRSISGTKGTDDFRFYYFSYSFNLQNSVEILKSDKTAKVVSQVMIADLNTTLTEANAVNKLASSFTVIGNVLTITANSVLDDVYDVMKIFKTRPIQSQLEYPTIDTQPVVASGKSLITAMSIVVNNGTVFSSGTKFNTITANVTITGGELTNLTIAGTLTQNVPTNLSNVNATTLIYNTATDVSVTLTNCIFGTIKNDGVGIVTVLKSGNTSITDYSDVQINFLDSTLSFFGITSITAYPTANDRDNNTNIGFTTTTSPFNFKFGSVISGITLSGIVYLRITVGGSVQLTQVTIFIGDNSINLSDNSLLQGLQTNLQKVNRNVIKSSKFKTANETF